MEMTSSSSESDESEALGASPEPRPPRMNELEPTGVPLDHASALFETEGPRELREEEEEAPGGGGMAPRKESCSTSSKVTSGIFT